ncbi:MAG TPA: hypothetical protein PLQ93_05950 [Bacteroidia bacterium]|nr:hypothetical protein [Bacteroidia bacterium]
MKLWIQKHRRSIIAAGLGALAAYLYYAFVGCKSGTCLIVSRPYIIIPYGALMAFLLAGTFENKKTGGEERS